MREIEGLMGQDDDRDNDALARLLEARRLKRLRLGEKLEVVEENIRNTAADKQAQMEQVNKEIAEELEDDLKLDEEKGD